MRRRDFIKGTTALTAGSMLAGDPFTMAPASAQNKSEVLLAVFELLACRLTAPQV